MSDTRLPSASGTLRERADDLPSGSALLKAYPNPFQQALTVRASCNAGSTVESSVVDVLGRRRHLGKIPCSHHGHIVLDVNADQLTAGVYFVVVHTSTHLLTLPVTKL